MNLRDHLEKVYKDLELANNSNNVALNLEHISNVFTWVDDALTIIQDKQVDFAMIVESQDYDDYQDKMDLYIRTILSKKLGARYTHDGVKKTWCKIHARWCQKRGRRMEKNLFTTQMGI